MCKAFLVSPIALLALISLASFGQAQEPEKLLPLAKPQTLFDGSTLNGWMFYTDNDATRVEEVWTVENGTLKCKGKPAGYLQTKRWYRDYELSLQWRWPGKRGGNSGVLVHTSTPLVFYGWPKSMEVQLQAGSAGDFWVICEGVDVRVENESQRRPKPRAGDQHSHRRIKRLQGNFEKPIGEWNSMKILCRRNEIKVFVNGNLVNYGTEMTVSEGAIALQSEGTPIEFREIQLTPLPASDNSTSDWSRFRFGTDGTNSVGTTKIKNPKVSWKYDTGDIIESSSIVSGNTVYVGGHSKRLHAIDRVTGKLKWKFDVGGWLRATPSIADGLVFFGADDNKFYALKADSGELAWSFNLGKGGEQSSPTILDGIVYFGAFDHFVYALKAKTGELVWKSNVGASMLSSPLVTDDALYIGTYAGTFFRVNRSSGEIAWSFRENDQPIFSSPIIVDDAIVFTSYDQHVYAVSQSDGSILWKYKTEASIFSSPTCSNGNIYVGSNDDHLYCLNGSDGKLRWKTNLEGAVFSSPTVSGSSIYVGSSDGNVYALDPSGKILWKHLVKEGVKVWTSPAAVDGSLYFGSHDGDVIALTDDNSENE